jgi:hypothetical protein
MSLSEEGSSVSCIAIRAGNRSTFFVGWMPQKKKRKNNTHEPMGFPRQASPPIPALGYRGRSPAASPHLGGQLESAFLKVEGDDFPVHHVHGVKLVWGPPGQVKHVEARAFESNNASPPKGRAIWELLEQIVSMVHRSPFLATH